MVALLLTAILWASPPPTIWVCNPGKSPMLSAPSNCQQLHFRVLAKFRLF